MPPSRLQVPAAITKNNCYTSLLSFIIIVINIASALAQHAHKHSYVPSERDHLNPKPYP
jgi:hypothetical protein